MWTGILLKESLKDTNVLAHLQVTQTEIWQVKNATGSQPSTWTALTFEADDQQAEMLADGLSQFLHPEGWYINASTASEVYVIFPNKVFKYLKGDSAKREEAKEHGRTLGIPESQLDWRE